MTVVPFTLCLLWCAVSPSEAAMTLSSGEGRVHIAGGWGTLLPTLTLGGTAGVAQGLDLDLRWETYAGIAHDVTLTSRYSFSEHWATSLSVNNVFYVIEEAGGIRSTDSPLGTGVGVASVWHRSFFFSDGVHVGFGAGLSLGVARLVRNEDESLTREAEFRLTHATFRVSVEWEDGTASNFMRFSAVIPIQTEAHLLGYFPHVSFGRSFGL